MRKRLYVAVLGLCGLGLLTPAVSRAADCTQGQPIKETVPVGNLSVVAKVVCKGDWTVDVTVSLGVDKVTAEFTATEVNTGKECSGTMLSPTGGVEEFDTQQAKCKFTKDQQIKYSLDIKKK